MSGPFDRLPAENMMILRFAAEQDYPAMLEIYAPYVREQVVSAEYFVPSLATFSARMHALAGKFPVLVMEEAGELLGYCYLSPAFERRSFAWDADLSIYVKEDARGRGIGRRLEGAASHIAKLLGYRRIYALVTGENEASIRFHEYVGYRVVAAFPEALHKFGRWIDLVWLEKEVNPPETCSDFPRPLSFLPENILEEL